MRATSTTVGPLTLEELVKLPDDQLDVARGAILIAKDIDPEVDLDKTLAAIDSLASELPDLTNREPFDQAVVVTEHFRKLGFLGNTKDYYDARNSLLPEVIQRRTGIPITLSILWCAIAQRVGVNAHGVAFPGHFLVRVDKLTNPSEMQLVDPFANGRLLDEEAAKDLLRRALGQGADLHLELFAAATPRAILVRLLSNLKSIFASRGEHARAFLAVDRIVALGPDSARNLRERAAVGMKLGAFDLARHDLARVLELEPEAPDAKQIQAQVADLDAPHARKQVFN